MQNSRKYRGRARNWAWQKARQARATVAVWADESLALVNVLILDKACNLSVREALAIVDDR